MILRIAGVNHDDPSGPAALRSWLLSHGQSGITLPSFLATEWNEVAFDTVKVQRPRFRKLAEAEWPEAPSGLLDILEQTLGYEGDAHVAIYPDSEVIWLGSQPIPGDERLRDYAEDRLIVYRSLLEGAHLPNRTEAALRILGDAAHRRAMADVGDTQRDRDFAVKIMDKAQGLEGNWAGVIVGANHAADNEWSMRRVLEDHGYTCHVTIL